MGETPQRREVQRGQGGVIFNETLPLDPYEKEAVKIAKEGVEAGGHWGLLENASRDADLIIADEIPGFDEMKIREKITRLNDLLDKMLINLDNSERYAYGEINRRMRLLEVDLEYRISRTKLGVDPQEFTAVA